MRRALTTLLALGLTGALSAPAGAAPIKNTKSPAETSSYWTSQRMKDAKPRERAKPGGGGGGNGKVTDWKRYTVPVDANQRYAGENRKNGKVFMTIDGANYVCSGTAVEAASGINLVWTAGHCVTDGPGHEATNFLFVPGYRNGQEPEGRWAVIQSSQALDSTPDWEDQGPDRFTYDVGAVKVAKVGSTTASFTSPGEIGTRPIRFSRNPTNQRLVSYGYPAAGKFNGAVQYACASPFRRWDDFALRDPMQISCDMTGGSSGGGWIHDVNANDVGDSGEPLVSVNSYGYPGEKNTMYGPYMPAAGQAADLYTRMSGLAARQ